MLWIHIQYATSLRNNISPCNFRTVFECMNITLYHVTGKRVACCMCSRSGLSIGNYYGSGTGPIWLVYVYCSGNEATIAECIHRGWGDTQNICSHSDDVSIVCHNSNCYSLLTLSRVLHFTVVVVIMCPTCCEYSF